MPHHNAVKQRKQSDHIENISQTQFIGDQYIKFTISQRRLVVNMEYLRLCYRSRHWVGICLFNGCAESGGFLLMRMKMSLLRGSEERRWRMWKCVVLHLRDSWTPLWHCPTDSLLWNYLTDVLIITLMHVHTMWQYTTHTALKIQTYILSAERYGHQIGKICQDCRHACK